jgi:hypothetical protein
LPFLVTATFEVVLLVFVWLAPHAPFSSALAPPIRFFFSDRVLHYPLHLWFMYFVMKHTNAAAAILVGAFMSGLACEMVAQARQNKPISLRAALISGHVHYGRLTLIWGSTWLIAKGLIKLFMLLAPKVPGSFWMAVALSIVLQSLLVYAIPAAVFERHTWWRALLRSIQESLRHPVSTILIVTLPSALVMLFAFSIPPGRLMPWMQRIAPEIALAVVGARLVIWTIADALMTVGVAHLWWAHRAQGSQAAEVGVAPDAVRRDPLTA